MHTNLMSQTVCSRFALRAENERRLIKGVGILIFWRYLKQILNDPFPISAVKRKGLDY